MPTDSGIRNLEMHNIPEHTSEKASAARDKKEPANKKRGQAKRKSKTMK